MVPKSFLCPITQEIMEHPVLDCVGNCYEKAAIENWFRQCAICSNGHSWQSWQHSPSSSSNPENIWFSS